MKNKINYLFAESQIRKRRTADEDEFLQANRELLESASQVFKKALDKLLVDKSLARPMDRDKNWAAVTMNGYVCGLMRDLFPGRMKYKGGSWSYFGNRAKVKFKLLDDNYLPSNVITNQVLLDRHQLTLLNEPSNPIIYVGYRMNSSFTEIIGCYAVCIDEWKVVRWIIDLDEIVNNEIPVKGISSLQIEASSKDDLGPIVKLKDGKLRKANE